MRRDFINNRKIEIQSCESDFSLRASLQGGDEIAFGNY
jgi:hypothetical protein